MMHHIKQMQRESASPPLAKRVRAAPAGERFTERCVYSRAYGTDEQDLEALYATLLERVPLEVRFNGEPIAIDADAVYRAAFGAPTFARVCDQLSRLYYYAHPEQLPARDYFAAANMPGDVRRTLLRVPPDQVERVSRAFRTDTAAARADLRLLADVLLADTVIPHRLELYDPESQESLTIYLLRITESGQLAFAPDYIPDFAYWKRDLYAVALIDAQVHFSVPERFGRLQRLVQSVLAVPRVDTGNVIAAWPSTSLLIARLLRTDAIQVTYMLLSRSTAEISYPTLGRFFGTRDTVFTDRIVDRTDALARDWLEQLAGPDGAALRDEAQRYAQAMRARYEALAQGVTLDEGEF